MKGVKNITKEMELNLKVIHTRCLMALCMSGKRILKVV